MTRTRGNGTAKGKSNDGHKTDGLRRTVVEVQAASGSHRPLEATKQLELAGGNRAYFADKVKAAIDDIEFNLGLKTENPT